MAKSPYDSMSLDELSMYIGNKNKAKDIYSSTGGWDSDEQKKLSQDNAAIRNKYGLSDDLDIGTLNNMFSNRVNSYDPKSNQISSYDSFKSGGNNSFSNTLSKSTNGVGGGGFTGANFQVKNEPVKTEWNAQLHRGMDGREKAIFDDDFVNGITNNPLVKGMQQNYYDQGEKAYKSNMAGINSYTGGKNTWSERIAADSRNDYNKQAANVVPMYAQMGLDAMRDFTTDTAGLDSEYYNRYTGQQARNDALDQQKFMNDLAVSELMGGATYGLRASQNPYLNADGTVKGSYIDQDFGTMIANLNPNDSAYDQRKYQLEQARFAKVQDPRYSQFANGVVAPVSAAPIYAANPENPDNQLKLITNALTKEYGPQEYQAKIAAQNIANEGGTLQNEWYPKLTQAEIDTAYGDLAVKKQNANTASYSARKSGSGGGSSGLTPYQQLQFNEKQLAARDKKVGSYVDQMEKLFVKKGMAKNEFTGEYEPTGEMVVDNAGAERYVQNLYDKGLITGDEATYLAGAYNLDIRGETDIGPSGYDNQILAGH
ncbi:MAG TPA: hypothetical protein VEF53_18915 [Patescibacteria group bacterium]|nr:hypothetical protein [Patescibacteria group bacterium]